MPPSAAWKRYLHLRPALNLLGPRVVRIREQRKAAARNMLRRSMRNYWMRNRRWTGMRWERLWPPGTPLRAKIAADADYLPPDDPRVVAYHASLPPSSSVPRGGLRGSRLWDAKRDLKRKHY